MPRKKRFNKRGRPPNGKKIRIVELDEVYDTYRKAAIRLGVNPGNVWLCLNGDRRTCGGFTFEYVKDEMA